MKSQFVRKTILLLVFTIALTNVNIARADVAPPEPPSGTNPMPGEELTNVRMVAETVLIDIDGDSPYDEGLATVTATFTMRNLGNVDEQMDVRFPLDQTLGWGKICASPNPQFAPIEDLKVKVNGQAVASQKTYESITVFTEKEPYPTVTLPCWEHFPVSFPAGKDVIIQVTYTTEPYHDYATWAYAYVLETGAGWKDTIGAADIIFQLPYELNNSNFYSCWPEDCALNGNKIQWHYEGFEPTSNVGISLFPPPLLQRIAMEKENVTRNPNDGEAWGRLAKAYKESIMEKRGFRSEPAAIERYRLSMEAYQRAVNLLPNDADWHYGFAELLCINAEWNNLLGEPDEDMWRKCVEQIRQTFNINSKHEKANELLEDVAKIQIEHVNGYDVHFHRLVDLSGPQPDFLILTPEPTSTITPVEAAAPAQDLIQPTATQLPTTQTTETATLIPTSTVVVVTTPASESSNMSIYLGAVAFGLMILVGILKLRKG